MYLVWFILILVPFLALILMFIQMYFKHKLLKQALKDQLLNDNRVKLTINTGYIRLPKVIADVV